MLSLIKYAACLSGARTHSSSSHGPASSSSSSRWVAAIAHANVPSLNCVLCSCPHAPVRSILQGSEGCGTPKFAWEQSHSKNAAPNGAQIWRDGPNSAQIWRDGALKCVVTSSSAFLWPPSPSAQLSMRFVPAHPRVRIASPLLAPAPLPHRPSVAPSWAVPVGAATKDGPLNNVTDQTMINRDHRSCDAVTPHSSACSNRKQVRCPWLCQLLPPQNSSPSSHPYTLHH